jgi:nucleoside-diphosphate-sugar epimerase
MSSANRRVLVTGATGFIGTRVCQVLDESELDVVRTPPRAELDLADRSATAEFVGNIRPDAIIHLAASLSRAPDGLSADAQWSDTLVAGRNVIDAGVESGATHLIMAGSLDELGPGMDPDHPRPITSYGLCKLMLLTIAEHAARTNEVAIDWFRASTVYGPGQRGPMLIPYVLSTLASGQPADVSDGRQRRDFLFVDDLVDWVSRCVRSAPPRRHEVEIHHLGNGQPTQVLEVLEEIRTAFPDGTIHIGAVPRRQEEPESIAMPVYSPDRPCLAGWRPRVDIASGLRQTIGWWLGGQHKGAINE